MTSYLDTQQNVAIDISHHPRCLLPELHIIFSYHFILNYTSATFSSLSCHLCKQSTVLDFRVLLFEAIVFLRKKIKNSCFCPFLRLHKLMFELLKVSKMPFMSMKCQKSIFLALFINRLIFLFCIFF